MADAEEEIDPTLPLMEALNCTRSFVIEYEYILLFKDFDSYQIGIGINSIGRVKRSSVCPRVCTEATAD